MELEHRYGEHVHLLDDPYLLSLLARIGSPETGTQALPALVRSTYQRLCAEVLAREFPVVQDRVKTRMAATEPRAIWNGPRLCRNTKLVVCAVIRAGILPAQTCYDLSCEALPPSHVRLDFLNLARTVDEQGRVTGIERGSSKIGGSVEDAVVLIPDPMGATGSTIDDVAQIYTQHVEGTPRAIVALHMMVTPEAIQHLRKKWPDLAIYSARLDRGLSAPEVLASVPGTHPERERGLTDIHYIVPGAGGMGELLTNSWV